MHTDIMTHQKLPWPPVLYLHAKGRERARPDEVEALLALGCVVCSRLEGDQTVRTEYGYGQPVMLLRELAERFPGQPVGFIRAGLQPDAWQLAELAAILEGSGGPLAIGMMSNASPELNPFAGLAVADERPDWDPGELVGLLAPGYLHRLEHWCDHFALLSPAAVERIAAGDAGSTLMQNLSAAGGRLVVPDHLFLHDADRDLFMARQLQPHESLYPPPFGDLSARLQRWLDAGIGCLPFAPSSVESATLHITHNWGGGIAHWIRTLIETDEAGVHFQLRAEGPQSDRGCGQRLSLYAGNELGCPVASWWLQPPIRSVEDHIPTYRDLLERLCRRYRIGRIVISSLIGHSLDALRTGLPTLQVLHDHFPLWPLLSVHPEPWLREDGPVDIEAALSGAPGKMEFSDKDAGAWADIRQAYLRSLAEHDVRIVAPGRSVLDLQCRLDPAFSEQKTQVIPHGVPSGADRQAIVPRARKDGRLRMVILGRIQAGKGQQLLLEAMEELAGLVQVYLVGSGMSGEKFFGIDGVDIILEYAHDELPAILESIGPDFAALLSIVPETFSYTLSELQLMGIPAIATRVGSFPDRIAHGKTGWLIDPSPRALVEQVAALSRAPAAIEAVRSALHDIEVPTIAAMREAYERAWPSAPVTEPFIPADPGEDQAQFAASAYQLTLSEQALENRAEQITDLREELETRTEELSREIETRTEWALDVQQQLEREHEVRLDVEHGLAATRASLAQVQQHLASIQASLADLENRHQELWRKHQRVLGSRSWRITRPLRFAHRVANNFMLARAWNPLRWPRLLGNFFRNLSSAGLGGAIQALQYGSESLAVAEPEPQSKADESVVANVVVQAPASFPDHDQPDASIVIPVYNNWPVTAACLRSLADTAGRYSFEVIVVDDGSSDESEDELSAIGGLKYVRNDQNLGFVGSCNRGAALARGEYLVMLNNDTEVTPGWLDELIDTLRREPDAGLVGARLVYPDGRLQESGGMIFRDGSGWNYGRGEDADKPEYNHLREADYCSGACILLPTELFRELGGFDERFAPAYYEDTDLAFRVRETGLKVLVQPAATVIHHEGATSGTDLNAGMKQYQRINQEKFIERWREALKQQPEDIADKQNHAAMRAASLHRVRGQTLFIGSLAAESSADSPAQLAGLAKCCKGLGYGVTMIDPGNGASVQLAAGLRRAGIEILDAVSPDSLTEFLRENGPAFGHVFISGQGVDGAILDLLKSHCKGSRIVFDAEDQFPDDGEGLAEYLKSAG